MILTHLVLFSFFNGAGGTVTPPTGGPLYDTTPIVGAGSGKNRKKLDHKAIEAKELARLLEALGEEPATAVQAAKVVAEHSKPRKKNAAPQIDMAGLLADIQAVQWILDAYQQLQHQRRMRDEDDAFMMLM